ncbi:unnamed protein product [Brachionus calyciflorus]|uniref:Cyclin A n=1 Tax=Brachionus calyciflorus TaxID=104777 RepID=A0A813N4G9_9BILA|nr:unnamed protein product [Brachionus calyciflorus]
MSKRQALGVLSNNNAASNNAQNVKPNKLKNSSSFTTAKTVANQYTFPSSTSHNQLLNQLQFNDENEPPQCVINSLLKSDKTDFDFEIYQEKINEDLQEEGISKLNIINDVDLKSMNSSHSDSPMMLDDTIKFQSIISKIDDECDNEFDDDDEETKKKIAAHERENVLMNCLEYKDDIMKYMRQLEKENRAKTNYMKKQLDITCSMRSILIDWLVEVSEEYKLNVETLYLAVDYTDRFLSQMSVLRGKLQLVGTASMYIAAKYEEITPPDVNEFVYITDDTYTKKQVLRMEHLLLKVLDFKMSPPTINWFLSHYLRFIKLSTSLSNPNNQDLYSRIENLSRYLAELTLIDADTFLAYLPSQIAASAIYLSMYCLNNKWTKQIGEICGYELDELKSCVQDMFKAMQTANSHPQQAIQEKYKQAKYDHVSLIDPPKTLDPKLTN